MEYSSSSMAVLGWFRGRGPSGFGYSSTAEQVTEGLELAGKTFLLTGCTSGLGLETLRVLALRGARVLALGRTLEKASSACERVARGAVPLGCDLSEPRSVLACVDSVLQRGVQLDGIICNAGVMLPSRVETKHGYELQFLTNHLGHFSVVTRLLDRLTSRARVVVVSSEGHRLVPRGGIAFDNLSARRGYSMWTAYGQSKLANLLFVKQLATRFADSGRIANAVHPGVIVTNLTRTLPSVLASGYRAISGLACKTIPQGAATQCYVATHPSVSAYNGEYFSDCNLAQPSAHANDAKLAQRLWEFSEAAVAELTSR